MRLIFYIFSIHLFSPLMDNLYLSLDILPMPKGRGFLQRDGHARPREDSNITTIFSHSLNDLLFSLHISMRDHPTENNCTTFVVGDLLVKASDYTAMMAQIKKKYNNYCKILSPYIPMPLGRGFTANHIRHTIFIPNIFTLFC